MFGELTTAESVAISLQRHRAWFVPNIGSLPMSAGTERRLRGDACEILGAQRSRCFGDIDRRPAHRDDNSPQSCSMAFANNGE